MAFVSISSFLNYIFPLNTFILYNFAQKERNMIMKTRLSVTLVHLLFAVSAVMAQEQYNNPVINESLPDPTVIKADDGYFYLYATENIRNVPIYRSENLVDWRRVGTAFTDRTRPQMVPKGNIWAPDINLINGKYVMYYSKSTWGGEWECGIGVATADRPSGPFTDVGKLFISSEIGVQNSIDPFYIEEDDGSKYLFWGSFRGIYGIQLSDDGLSIKPGAQKVQIAGTLTEGTYIYKHDGYYYLFGSAGTCCEGLNSTYRVMVARSENLMGPYVNKSGRPALENNFMLVMQKSNKVVGPGHNSEIIQDDAGQYWMLYHGFDAKVHKEDDVPFKVITKNAGIINSVANSLLPKSNPTSVDIRPREYYVEWKRDIWSPFPLYLFGACINGAMKTFLPGLFVHEQVSSKVQQKERAKEKADEKALKKQK